MFRNPFESPVDPIALDFFEKQQQSDEANVFCADCGTANPKWASVSHGIYLSIEACGVHRSLGVRVSRALSTTMDSWKPVQLRMMELGGNRRFEAFLRFHQIPEDMPIREKYMTRAAEWYRENLLAEALGNPGPSPLAEGTGHLPVVNLASTSTTVVGAECCPSEEQVLLDKILFLVDIVSQTTDYSSVDSSK